MPFFVLKEKSKERTRPSLFPIEGERDDRVQVRPPWLAQRHRRRDVSRSKIATVTAQARRSFFAHGTHGSRRKEIAPIIMNNI